MAIYEGYFGISLAYDNYKINIAEYKEILIKIFLIIFLLNILMMMVMKAVIYYYFYLLIIIILV